MKLINIINNFSAEGDAPRFYLKADTALLRNNDAFYIPEGVGKVVASPSMVLRVSRLAKCIGERFALRCIDAVMGGVCFTAKDRLDALRSEGLPWDEAVGFDHSSALSLDVLDCEIMSDDVRFLVNGEERAKFSVGDMRFANDKLVSSLSEAMTLRIGDLIYLGSPVEVEVKAGDNYRLMIGEHTVLNFDIK
jgi:2-keto-4-pentenoate hydratase/2-oxohepta-3-ene-1,7-dioic acid hydratase in catechol pathway